MNISRRAIELVAERRIQDAVEKGEFDSLPGTGKPLAGLDEAYDENWWLKRWLRREELTSMRELRRQAGLDR